MFSAYNKLETFNQLPSLQRLYVSEEQTILEIQSNLYKMYTS